MFGIYSSLPVFGTRLASDHTADAGFDAVIIVKLLLLTLEKKIMLGSVKFLLVILVDNSASTDDEIVPRLKEVTAGVGERLMIALGPIVK